MQEYLCAPPPRVPASCPSFRALFGGGTAFLLVKALVVGLVAIHVATSSPSVGELELISSHPQQLRDGRS